jgi:chromosome segregation ATPase
MSTPEKKTPIVPFRQKTVVAGQWNQKKKPAEMIAWVVVALALAGNVVQYSSSRSEVKAAETTLALARAKWENERNTMETELVQLRRQTQLTGQDRAMLTIELDKIRFDLVSIEQQIYKAEVDRAGAARRLKEYEELQRPKFVEAQRKIIEAIDKKVAFLRNEQDALLTRRTELQSMLNR